MPKVKNGLALLRKEHCCHPERSEGSRLPHIPARFFATMLRMVSVRMTGMNPSFRNRNTLAWIIQCLGNRAKCA